MNREKFLNYSLEVILQVLKKYDLELKTSEKNNDEEKIKLLKEEIIPKYDRLYFGLKHSNFEEKSEEEINGIEKIITDILVKHNMTKDFIEKCQETRESLKGKSGSEVTEKLFNYTIKNLKKKKAKVYDVLNPVLKKEEELETAWKECIQYEEEMKVASEIVDIREKKRDLQEELDKIDFTIKQIEYDLDCGWKYEIFGTISKEELENHIK